MTLGTILLIILILLLIGALPAWPYSRGWGYYPTGGLGLLLIIILILVLMGRISAQCSGQRRAAVRSAIGAARHAGGRRSMQDSLRPLRRIRPG